MERRSLTVLRFLSRGLYDSLVHVTEDGSWSECASFCAKQLLSLKVALESPPAQHAEAHVRKLTRKLMLGLLRFPLMGRPSHAGRHFLSGIHCYWAKFPFSCICNLLHKVANAQGSLLRQVDERFTFIGPAPRALFGALHGDAADQQVQLHCLQDLRQVRDWIAEEFDVQHALYNVQITPCDWQHFLRARESFPAHGAPLAGTRGGSISATQSLLLTLALHEEEMMRARAAAMKQLEWVQENWAAARHTFTVIYRFGS